MASRTRKPTLRYQIRTIRQVGERLVFLAGRCGDYLGVLEAEAERIRPAVIVDRHAKDSGRLRPKVVAVFEAAN